MFDDFLYTPPPIYHQTSRSDWRNSSDELRFYCILYCSSWFLIMNFMYFNLLFLKRWCQLRFKTVCINVFRIKCCHGNNKVTTSFWYLSSRWCIQHICDLILDIEELSPLVYFVWCFKTLMNFTKYFALKGKDFPHMFF